MTDFLQAVFDAVLSQVWCEDTEHLSEFFADVLAVLPPEEVRFVHQLDAAALGEWVLDTVPPHWVR